MKLLRLITLIAGALWANRALQRRGFDVVERAEDLLAGLSDETSPQTGPSTDRLNGEAPATPQRSYDAVDHKRQAGVPPEHNDDYKELLDIEGAESFPASDPPSGW
ncbi:MAG: hypothetical protein ABI200_01345 [Gaiellales bacterium]